MELREQIATKHALVPILVDEIFEDIIKELTVIGDEDFRPWCEEHQKRDDRGVCQTSGEATCNSCQRKAQLDSIIKQLRGE